MFLLIQNNFFLPTPLIATYFIIYGLIMGSFLNVCISRIPRGLSIVSPRSRCPECLNAIRWFENIPIFSYLFLKGRCRHCKKKIALIYPLIEILSASLAYICYLHFGHILIALLWFSLFICPLIVLSFIDLEHMILPDILTLPGIGLGILTTLLTYWMAPQFELSFFSNSEDHWFQVILDSFMGALAGGGILFLLYFTYLKIRKIEGLGQGDIKLSAMLGAFLGWKAIFIVFFFASILGSVIGILLMWKSGKGRQMQIPFGPFLALGALIYLFLGEFLITLWLRYSFSQ